MYPDKEIQEIDVDLRKVTGGALQPTNGINTVQYTKHSFYIAWHLVMTVSGISQNLAHLYISINGISFQTVHVNGL